MPGELPGNGVPTESAYASQSARPSIPAGLPAQESARSAKYATLQGSARSTEGASAEAASPSEQDNGGPSSVRSNGSAGSTMSTGEKEREKARLQRLVKDFAKEAVTGIAVNLLNEETTRKTPHFFQMDRYLTVFSLKPKDGSTGCSSVQDFNVKDLITVYKGGEIAVNAPSLSGMTSCCVGIDTNRNGHRLFLQFDDNYERDKFYTCLNILRMSIEISGSA